MEDTVNLLEKIIQKFQHKPETFEFLLNKNKEIGKMISLIHDKYMSLPKFSELIKEDNRKYKSYYCGGGMGSVSGIITLLKKNKFYKLESKDAWDLYIPSGYNNIEDTLCNLKPNNENQIFFGIQGCDNLVGKTTLWNILEKTYGRDEAKELLPETFVLSNEEHVNLFKDNYKEGELYILKGKKQRKEGLKLTRDFQEIIEAKDKDFTLVQDYKRNLLLVNKRKLNLRIYLLLTIKNGIVEAFINKFGTCIYSNKDYDDSVLDFENNITSYNLDMSIYDTNPMTIRQLRTYLLDNGYDNPDILFERINKKVAKIVDAVKPHFGKPGNLNDNLCVQVFGMDVVVDKDLNPYILECNKGPDMRPKTEYKSSTDLINKLENFYESEDIVNKCYPIGYKSGNGLKAQKDILELLGIVESKNGNNGFYKIY